MVLKEKDGVVATYQSYDLLNRMTSFYNGENTATYYYDADNMRDVKTVNGVNTKQVWVGADIALDITDDNVVSYVYGTKLIQSDYGWYVYNAHGDVVSLTDESGTVTRDYDYDPYGVELGENNSQDTNPYRYSGQYTDLETGYVYLRARYYDASTGRFINQDPSMDGYNWYIYCAGNPIMYFDPTGFSFILVPSKYDALKEDLSKPNYKKNYIYKSNKRTDFYEKITANVIGGNQNPSYFAEFEGVQYPANSKETVILYDWKSIDNDFSNTMRNLTKNADEIQFDLTNVFKYSAGGGAYNFKEHLDSSKLYNINGVVYNSNEAGNFIWSYYMTSKGLNPIIQEVLVQFGTLAVQKRFDEPWDSSARLAGVEYAYEQKIKNFFGKIKSFFK